jgi:hypothetical protein
LLNRAGTAFRKFPDADREGLTEAKVIALMGGAAFDDQATGAGEARRSSG